MWMLDLRTSYNVKNTNEQDKKSTVSTGSCTDYVSSHLRHSFLNFFMVFIKYKRKNPEENVRAL